MDTSSSVARSITDGYVPRTKPFAKQAEALRKGAGKFFFAYYMDQGTGKTKVLWDNVAILYYKKIIDAVLIFAPNDVHDQWIDEQMPLHLPADIKTRAAVWRSNGHRAKRLCRELISHKLPHRLTILAMNSDAIAHPSGVKLAREFAQTYNVMLILDESHDFKTPKASRTINVRHRIRPFVKVVRLASGTPTDTPFDMFSQMAILDERILGFESFLAFKHHYAEFTKEFMHRKLKNGETKLQPYESLQEYKNLDEMQRRIEPYVFVCKKEDFADMPPKVLSLVYTHLTSEQETLYEQVKTQGLALLKAAEQGKPVTVLNLPELSDDELLQAISTPANRMTIKIKLTLTMRLQQIAGGFFTDDEGHIHEINPFAALPRAQALLRLIRGVTQGKILVWAQFKAELRAINNLIALESFRHGELVFGETSKAARAASIAGFKDPRSDLTVLTAHPKTLGTGQNFQVAQTEVFYSNGRSSIRRTQCEDRCHRIGQTGTVSIYDLIGCKNDKVVLDDIKEKRGVNDSLLSLDAARLAEVL